MHDLKPTEARPQGLTTEQFFYFFLRLRKGEVRRTVQVLRTRYPEEGPRQHAQRVVAAKTRLSALGGTLLYVPALFPGVGQGLKLAGVVGGGSMLTRMHLYMILEIALLFGRDIDDISRVPEMSAVVAATGLGAAAPLLLQLVEVPAWYALPAGGLSTTLATQLIGQSAIHFYAGEVQESPIPRADNRAY